MGRSSGLEMQGEGGVMGWDNAKATKHGHDHG